MRPARAEQLEAVTGYIPAAGMHAMYRERGGVNWFRCAVIHHYQGLVLLDNFDTGSKPLKRLSDVQFTKFAGLEATA